MPAVQRRRLHALAKDLNKSSKGVLDVLAEINAIAAEHSKGSISKGCWVTSQTIQDGGLRSASRNVGVHQGAIHMLHHGIDLSELCGEVLEKAIKLRVNPALPKSDGSPENQNK